MFNIGTQELLVILLIALIIVGPSRLPELSRSIGKGLREFRKVQDEVKDMVKLDLEEPTKRPKPATPTAPGAHRASRPAPSQPPGAPGSSDAAEPDAEGPDLDAGTEIEAPALEQGEKPAEGTERAAEPSA